MQRLRKQDEQERCEEMISAVFRINHEITKATTTASSAVQCVRAVPTNESVVLCMGATCSFVKVKVGP